MDYSDLGDQIVRKMFKFDKICYKKCIPAPDRSLTSPEEYCLKSCAAKIANGIEYLDNLNRMSRTGGVDKKNPRFS